MFTALLDPNRQTRQERWTKVAWAVLVALAVVGLAVHDSGDRGEYVRMHQGACR